MKHVLNLKPSLKDKRNFKFCFNNVALPQVVDLRAECSPIMDQGQIGSCSGNALAGCIEFLELKELDSQTPATKNQEYGPTFKSVSRLFIYWNERALEGTTQTDAGATTLKDGCEAILHAGVCTESSWPYLTKNVTRPPLPSAYREAFFHRIEQYLEVGQDLVSIQSSLAMGFPIACGIMIYDSFESDITASNGQIPLPKAGESMLGGHAVMIVGYDMSTKMFLLRNSWGTSWGLRGYAWIPFQYLTDNSLTSDLWTLRI